MKLKYFIFSKIYDGINFVTLRYKSVISSITAVKKGQFKSTQTHEVPHILF